ncbi:hypothetical protein A3A54_00355 [Candidatus Curtissbacteria bacterium RIFCSPLOWO2_01_FULL_39_62]|uniref:Uncharacterized protein n=2 Tax=Candidatus Curtissiibacteriota TaxID=1752717 RepID=A0A1F5G7F6_9BACT|nr:MAG: hypothetical protein A2775_00050 [Candidatus Curtissbacteria bacterium RIFCSPHIGHO2_01_FULL_39_57]OGD87781.1 MAG: hypothetical protein A3D04_02310 [Candidatus Curtissbacteria bacterium RIFCSPHIGHO2_02_FULL_40_16b]OGD90015.1 MAG: hypothetical protein A3E11_02230 [Candidatus Curtissbacteria bacterium RIFCSPHIGHO2_12_FULL_38_37]OGD99848.1 MAG: hypothetical protein A3J17_04700 [Candidatus Curtissbacteria bacterium RIFCSPLOWO2_02_FULL_40_11]OGE02656.1 MAG: hypothetical protein A3A54_00355 [C
MSEIENLKTEIEKIKARNRRVEKDKDWETSLTRRIAIAAITYVLITIFLIIVGVEKPFLASIIPAIAFLISTATLNILKNWWLKNQ